MWISPAFAQGAGAPGGADMIVSMLPIVAIVAIFYFLLIRPQSKRAKEHKAMLEAVRRGDKIVSNGGLMGTVTKVDDDVLTVEIAKDIKVQVVRGMIAEVRSKGAPAEDKKDDEKKSGKDKDVI